MIRRNLPGVDFDLTPSNDLKTSSKSKQTTQLLLRVDQVDRSTLEKMMEQCIGETGRKAVKTAGELLIEEGIQQGIQQGLQQGVQQGLQQGVQQGLQQGEVKARIECILSLLQERNVTISPKDRKRIVACNDIDTLAHWFRRSMQAKNVQELFDS